MAVEDILMAISCSHCRRISTSIELQCFEEDAVLCKGTGLHPVYLLACRACTTLARAHAHDKEPQKELQHTCTCTCTLVSRPDGLWPSTTVVVIHVALSYT